MNNSVLKTTGLENNFEATIPMNTGHDIVSPTGWQGIPCTFGVAIMALKEGKRVAREGWGAVQGIKTRADANGERAIEYCYGSRVFIVLMPELQLPSFKTQDTARKVNDRTAKWIGEETPLDCKPYIAHYNYATNAWQPGWIPTQADLLAEDWVILD